MVASPCAPLYGAGMSLADAGVPGLTRRQVQFRLRRCELGSNCGVGTIGGRMGGLAGA